MMLFWSKLWKVKFYHKKRASRDHINTDSNIIGRHHEKKKKRKSTQISRQMYGAWHHGQPKCTHSHIHNSPKPLQSETRLPIKPNSVIILQALNIYGPVPTIPHLSFIICQQNRFSLWKSAILIHLENYRGTSHCWLLCSLYCYHQSKFGKQKSSVYRTASTVFGSRETDNYLLWLLGRENVYFWMGFAAALWMQANC